MTFRSFRFTSKKKKKCSKISLKTSPNPLEIGPGRLPKRHSTKTTGKRPTESTKSQNLLPNWVPGGGSPSPFSSLFRLRAPLGTKMVPRPPPRASGTPPGHHFFTIFIKFLMPFFVVFIDLGPIPGAVAGAARRATGYIFRKALLFRFLRSRGGECERGEVERSNGYAPLPF